MQIENSDSIQVCGSSLSGYVTSTYDELVAVILIGIVTRTLVVGDVVEFDAGSGRGNLIQSDTPLSEAKYFIKDAYEHTNQG